MFKCNTLYPEVLYTFDWLLVDHVKSYTWYSHILDVLVQYFISLCTLYNRQFHNTFWISTQRIKNTIYTFQHPYNRKYPFGSLVPSSVSIYKKKKMSVGPWANSDILTQISNEIFLKKNFTFHKSLKANFSNMLIQLSHTVPL